MQKNPGSADDISSGSLTSLTEEYNSSEILPSDASLSNNLTAEDNISSKENVTENSSVTDTSSVAEKTETPTVSEGTDKPTSNSSTGNTIGNHQISTFSSTKNLCIQGDCFYYPLYDLDNPEKRGIFEYSVSTGKERQVATYPGSFINVVGDYLVYRGALDYYPNNSTPEEEALIPSYSYKMICVNLKTLECTPLKYNGGSITCYNVTAYKNFVYYISMSNNALHRINLSDGSNTVIISEPVCDFYISDDTILFSASGEEFLISCDLNGKNRKTIIRSSELQPTLTTSDGSNVKFTSDGNMIYFSNAAKDLYQINTDSTGLALLESGLHDTFAALSGSVIKFDNKNGISVINKNSSSKKIVSENTSVYTLHNNKLYYMVLNECFSINLDGTGKTKIF